METVEVKLQEHPIEDAPEGIHPVREQILPAPAETIPAEAVPESAEVKPAPAEAKPAPAEANPAPAEAVSAPAETEPMPAEMVSEKKEETEQKTETAEQTAVLPEEETLPAAVEAILFAMGEAVPVSTLAFALGVSEDRINAAADLLAERFAARDCGLSLNRYEDCLQLSTKPELYEYLIRVASEPKKPKLTPTLLETLSIIAFRQPVTRLEVENIRGVNSDFAINRLISYDLVREVGRKEVPGRPLLFGTTQQFLRSFGLRSLEELPEPGETQMEMFREEAEDEVRTSLKI